MGTLKVKDCMECHKDYKTCVHNSVSCNDCHSGVTELPHKQKLKRPACHGCHHPTVEAIHKLLSMYELTLDGLKDTLRSLTSRVKRSVA